MQIKKFLKEEKAQASLEYLYLTAFVVALAAVAALLLQSILEVQEEVRAILQDYRDKILLKLTQ